jgi:hypothetical protein
MNRRFRTFAALLALLAFSGSFAEQARAAACASPAAAQSAEHHLPADSHEGGGDGAMQVPSAPAPHDGPAPEECPLQAVTAGCTLLLPPTGVSRAAPPADAPRALISPPADPSRALLLASPFFRPPQR